jgi:hypothetical protein
VPDYIFVVVEIAEELFGVFVDILWLLKQAGAEEVIQDLSQFWVAFQVTDVLLLNGVLDSSEIGLQL